MLKLTMKMQLQQRKTNEPKKRNGCSKRIPCNRSFLSLLTSFFILFKSLQFWPNKKIQRDRSALKSFCIVTKQKNTIGDFKEQTYFKSHIFYVDWFWLWWKPTVQMLSLQLHRNYQCKLKRHFLLPASMLIKYHYQEVLIFTNQIDGRLRIKN